MPDKQLTKGTRLHHAMAAGGQDEYADDMSREMGKRPVPDPMMPEMGGDVTRMDHGERAMKADSDMPMPEKRRGKKGGY